MILEYILLTLLILNLFLLFYQDVKNREVSWILFPIALVLSGIISVFKITFFEMIIFWGLNLIILGVLFLCLIGYVYFKFGKNANLWDYFGLGDVLFFVVLSINFSSFNFVLMLIFSLLFSLMLSILLLLKKKTVPLAGLQALFLIGVIIVQKIFDLNSFNENWIYLWL